MDDRRGNRLPMAYRWLTDGCGTLKTRSYKKVDFAHLPARIGALEPAEE